MDVRAKEDQKAKIVEKERKEGEGHEANHARVDPWHKDGLDHSLHAIVTPSRHVQHLARVVVLFVLVWRERGRGRKKQKGTFLIWEGRSRCSASHTSPCLLACLRTVLYHWLVFGFYFLVGVLSHEKLSHFLQRELAVLI